MIPDYNKGLVVAVLILVLGLVIESAYLINFQKNLKEDYCSLKNKKTTIKAENIPSLDSQEIGELYQKYFYQNNLANKETIKEWQISKINYEGYYNNLSTKLYKVTSSYTCLDGTYNCINQSQNNVPDSNGQLTFTKVITINYGNHYEITNVDNELKPSTDFIVINEVLK